MSESLNTVFISYRRDVSAFIARAIFLDLRAHGYDVFMDVEGIDSGEFGAVILNQIAARAHFLLILVPGTLDRCAEPDDWLRREIERAIDLKRNIVPILANRFEFDADTRAALTGKLSALPRYNPLELPHSYFDAAMDRLRTRFLKQPVYGAIQPAPPDDQPVVDTKLDEAANVSLPTDAELSAENCFNQGYAHAQTGDYAQALAYYTQAVELNPRYTDAYNNRGVVRAETGDLAGAIADYDAALRCSPRAATPYYNRGVARERQGDLVGAIADYDTALQINPQYVEAYNNRGFDYYHIGDYARALEDLDAAIALSTEHAYVFDSRGQVFFAAGQPERALADFQQANALQPNYTFALAGMAIAQHALGRPKEARRLWQALLKQDQRYRDLEWVQRQFAWAEPLVEQAHKLIATL